MGGKFREDSRLTDAATGGSEDLLFRFCRTGSISADFENLPGRGALRWEFPFTGLWPSDSSARIGGPRAHRCPGLGLAGPGALVNQGSGAVWPSGGPAAEFPVDAGEVSGDEVGVVRREGPQ